MGRLVYYAIVKRLPTTGLDCMNEQLDIILLVWKNGLFGALYGLVESFFKNHEGHNVTVNGDRYRAMITNFFIPELNNHDVQELWFQQDHGASCHTARATIDLLKDTFGDRLISRFGPVNWPPRSCDLTPLNYFLWGYVKSLVYADKPQTLKLTIWKTYIITFAVLLPICSTATNVELKKSSKKIKNQNWTSVLDWTTFISTRKPNFWNVLPVGFSKTGCLINENNHIFKICQVIYSQFGLAIHQNDHQARRRFVEWAQNEIAVVPDFHKRILFSDEAHFWLNGYVNKQNCSIWSEANPQVHVETPLHPEKLTVWCALWAGGIIGPYFFKNDEGHNVTVNARATIDLLKDTFGDRLISRFGPVNWPPRSCDLTPLDYFLWGYVKSLVYADKPQTLDHLEDNIRRVIADIRPQMLEKVIDNWTSRLDYIRASRGNHMPEIIFKI
ncbi:uncharacterized protein TNCV_5093471 [Trichonephila clavipes]|nr:uncharacterized protein TNCV_5093471 [Trichonephila clavipes]